MYIEYPCVYVLVHDISYPSCNIFLVSGYFCSPSFDPGYYTHARHLRDTSYFHPLLEIQHEHNSLTYFGDSLHIRKSKTGAKQVS